MSEYRYEANSSIIDTNAILSQSCVSFKGGSGELHYMSTIADRNMMRKWKTSLEKCPTMLDHDIELLPISHLIRICPNDPLGIKAVACRQALEKFLGGKFSIQTKKEEKMEENQENAEQKHQTPIENMPREHAADAVPETPPSSRSSSLSCLIL